MTSDDRSRLEIGRKKEEAIAALLVQRNLEDPARAVGISPKTFLRWMKEPEFDAAYGEARRTAFGQAVARLQQGASAAAMTRLKTEIESGLTPVIWGAKTSQF